MTGDPGAEQLGLALWTGVVVVVFVEIWPEAKRRRSRTRPPSSLPAPEYTSRLTETRFANELARSS